MNANHSFICSNISNLFIIILIYADLRMQKLKNSYNRPRTLTTQSNVPEMSAELRSEPPYEITEQDIGLVDNGILKPFNDTHQPIGTNFRTRDHNNAINVVQRYMVNSAQMSSTLPLLYGVKESNSFTGVDHRILVPVMHVVDIAIS